MIKIGIELGTFLSTTIGEIYLLSPNHKPRKIDEITDYIIDYFKTHYDRKFEDVYHIEMDKVKLISEVENILSGCKAVRELNLSTNEFKNGIDVDSDERGNTYCFITRYSGPPSEDEDFIDLWALWAQITAKLRLMDSYDYEVNDDPIKEDIHDDEEISIVGMNELTESRIDRVFNILGVKPNEKFKLRHNFTGVVILGEYWFDDELNIKSDGAIDTSVYSSNINLTNILNDIYLIEKSNRRNKKCL